MRNLSLLLLLGLALSPSTSRAGGLLLYSSCRLENLVTSPEVVVDPKDGSLRLAHSVLLSDETGATDWLQTEPLNEQVRARKVFHLDSAEVTSAELLFFGSATKLEVNGQEVTGIERLPSTGWSRVKLPAPLLKSGANEFRLWGSGQLLVEPSKQPGRSFKSTDAGRTWRRDNLTAKGNVEGEYLIRLRLGRYAPRGWAMTEPMDAFTAEPEAIGLAARQYEVIPEPLPEQPSGTEVRLFMRTGASPSPDDKNWTPWRPLREKHKPLPSETGYRWIQLKVELSTTQPQATPRLRVVGTPVTLARVGFETTPRASSPLQAKLNRQTSAPPRSSVPFVYEAPSPRLKFLREKYKLDDVIASGKTEMEQLMLLRYWIRNQWHTAWKSHPAGWMPPWDSLIILQNRDLPDCLTMCTHYACVFTQCAQALGWNARHCILDHHCVSEVYVNQHDKWVMMDTGNSAQRADVGLHFERDKLPLSARELHLAQRTGKTQGIEVCLTPAHLVANISHLCRPAPEPPKGVRPDRIPLAELAKYPVCQIENYRRYAFPPRNTFLTSLYPGELYQGYSEYYYDGYCWVGDSPDDPKISPEYSLHGDPARAEQADWKLNWTRIYLSRTARSDELRVDLATHTPNLARLEMRRESKGKKIADWQPTEASFTWKLEPGDNTLTVRSVNHWGKTGSESRAVIVYALD